MTTVAAFRDHLGAVAIASDRQLSTNVKMRIRKVARAGRFAVAGTGLGLIVTVLRDLGSDDDEAVSDFAARAFTAWEAAGQVRTGDNDKTWNMSFLMVEPGQGPWRVCGDQSIAQVDEGYDAIGSGSDVAIGVLYVARAEKWDARRALRTAVEAAVHHDLWTGGAVDVVVFGAPKASTPEAEPTATEDQWHWTGGAPTMCEDPQGCRAVMSCMHGCGAFRERPEEAAEATLGG